MTTWLSARHHNNRRQRCRRVCTVMRELPIQEELTPVTTRRGPRRAMEKEKWKRKANLQFPRSRNRRHPPPHHSNQTVVKTPEDGRHLRNGHTILSFNQTHHPSINSAPQPRNQCKEVHPLIPWHQRKSILVPSVQPAFVPKGLTPGRNL